MSMGGAQRSLSKLSLEFSKHHKVWLVIFNRNESVAYKYGGELTSLDVVSGESLFYKIRAFFQRVNRLRKLKKRLDIDVSISFLEGADYINILSKINDKIILSIRGSKRYDETIVGKFFWLRNVILIPWLYKYANAIVTVNHGIAKELRTFYGLKKVNITTIGNFYNIEEITRLACEPREECLNKLYADPVLIVTGRLAPEKGLKKLLIVFHELKKENRNLRLVIVGDGPELPELISIANRLNLRFHVGSNFEDSPDVLFLGDQPNVFKFLKGSTIFLMNSSSEGFPNSLAEAMICRVPVVSSDCPYGPREILEPEFIFASSIREPYFTPNGVLMPMIYSERETKIWVNTLRNILANSSILFEFSERGSKKISIFDQKLIAKQWYALLEERI